MPGAGAKSNTPITTPSQPQVATSEATPETEVIVENGPGSKQTIQRHVSALQQAGGQIARQSILRTLQRTYGNEYTSNVIKNYRTTGEISRSTPEIIQREVECAPEPVKPQPLKPTQDPGFKEIKGKIGETASKEKKHAPAKTKASESQKAASPPTNDIQSQAAANQVEEMGKQKPGTFDKAAFIKALNAAIEGIAPQNQEEADDFKKSGKAGELKGKVSGIVNKNKEESSKDIKETTSATPDASKATPKQVEPLKPEEPGQAPPSLGAEKAMPKPAPAEQVNLEAGKCAVNSQMEEAGVSEEQLKKSNEPEFQDALSSKKEAEVQAKKAPQEFRAEEKNVLGEAKAEAGSNAIQLIGQMHQGRSGALGKVAGNKDTTKAQDEAKRTEISGEIEKIYNTTKTETEKILAGLDDKVNTAFESGERDAKAAFENYVDAKMTAYKDERYDGITGAAQWLVDKVAGMPSEVNAFYQEGRQKYLKMMQSTIEKVADVVGKELIAAKNRISQGREQVKKYVAGQPKELQKIAQEAEQKFDSQFDQLESEVDSKQDSLVNDLAQKFVAARNSLDERINQLQAENKGLVDKAKEAIGGVIQTIIQLKNMLLGVLAKAAGAIDKIIKDPIGFLGNLVTAVKTGVTQFVSNIGTHLKKGLMGWLFGALAETGIELPQTFDIKGILSLILQVLGLTYQNIRKRIASIVGEGVVSKIEAMSDILQLLIKEGPGALWDFIKDKLSDLKDTVLGGIKDFVVDSIIKAGVSWLIGMLNPAGAFIKACKAIYDIVMFFIERGSQIMSLVNAITDSIVDIASGAIGGAAQKVEDALGKAVPVAIGFLASLLGVTGITDKIKSIIQKVQSPVNKAIDFVVKGIVGKFKGVIGKVKGGVDWAKNKAKQGVNFVKGKATALKDKVTGKSRDTEKKKEDEAQGVKTGVAVVNKLSGNKIGEGLIKSTLGAVKLRYRMDVLQPVKQNGFWAVQGEIRRMLTLITKKKDIDGKEHDTSLDTSGKFADPELEKKYQDYVERKKAQSAKSRERLDWFETRNIWNKGNTFNATRSADYQFNEVHLENGKRVDSYVEGREIISRKATNFDSIQESTFISYLEEILEKYPRGTIIRSDKYLIELDGKELKGKYILEIPDSNRIAKVKARFEALAKTKGIYLRFRAE